jgi:hypothetical protein
VRGTFDSNVFVSGLKYPGVPSRVLELAAVNAFRLQDSGEIPEETMHIPGSKFRWDAQDVASAPICWPPSGRRSRLFSSGEGRSPYKVPTVRFTIRHPKSFAAKIPVYDWCTIIERIRRFLRIWRFLISITYLGSTRGARAIPTRASNQVLWF